MLTRRAGAAVFFFVIYFNIICLKINLLSTEKTLFIHFKSYDIRFVYFVTTSHVQRGHEPQVKRMGKGGRRT